MLLRSKGEMLELADIAKHCSSGAVPFEHGKQSHRNDSHATALVLGANRLRRVMRPGEDVVVHRWHFI